MIDTYKELLYKNQLELSKLGNVRPESVFSDTIPIYQNSEIKRPLTDPYEIQVYRLPNGRYKKRILVHFDKLPDWLRGFTDGDRNVVANEKDYQPYLVLAHEATHIRHRDWPEYTVRTYSPRIRTLEELLLHFPEFEFVFVK